MVANTLWANHPMAINGFSNDEKWGFILGETERRLQKSDKAQLADSGLSISKRLEWQAYRDTLRSIQDDFVNPDDVIFPEEPAEE